MLAGSASLHQSSIWRPHHRPGWRHLPIMTASRLAVADAQMYKSLLAYV